MDTTDKKPFLSSFTVVIRLIPLFITIIYTIVILLLPINSSKTIGLLVPAGIFGVLICLPATIGAFQSARNLAYLKKKGYLEQMHLETPENFVDDLAITENFVFNKKRKICLPVNQIKSVSPLVVNYINSAAKSKLELNIQMDTDEKYCLLLKSGAITESKKRMLTNLISELVKMNPNITITK